MTVVLLLTTVAMVFDFFKHGSVEVAHLDVVVYTTHFGFSLFSIIYHTTVHTSPLGQMSSDATFMFIDVLIRK